MPELHELAEHIEHAGHEHAGNGGHGHSPNTGRWIGITMAVLGVMLAFCAAMVGSARTELVATMVEQSNRFSLYQAESMKLRVMEADVEMLHALTPTRAEVEKLDNALSGVKRVSGKADDEDTQELKSAIAVAAKEVAEVLSPDPEDEQHLKSLARRFEHDMKEAKEDAECYDDKIAAHFEAAEWYERAQLCAEIGIVIASVALLLSSRAVWLVALLFGAGSTGLILRTYMHTTAELHAAAAKIELAQQRTELIEGADEAPDEPADKPSTREGAADKPGEKPNPPSSAGAPKGSASAPTSPENR
jgi:hypothetical protein